MNVLTIVKEQEDVSVIVMQLVTHVLQIVSYTVARTYHLYECRVINQLTCMHEVEDVA